MEKITFDWCDLHNFTKQGINIASDISYFYETDTYIISFTRSLGRGDRITVRNWLSKDTITFETKTVDSITTKKLFDICQTVSIKYPFIDEIKL